MITMNMKDGTKGSICSLEQVWVFDVFYFIHLKEDFVDMWNVLWLPISATLS